MDNQAQQVTETFTNIQKVAQGPKFKIPRQLIIIIVSLIILVGAVGVAIYQSSRPKVTTTGSSSAQSISNPKDPYVELGKLLDMGTYNGNGFSFQKVTESTNVAVFLDKPYDKNQAVFQDWLKANGYGEIPQDKFVYFHNP